MSTPYKPMPDHPGYRINRNGWVKNANGYVVASGTGARLHVGGAGVYVSRKKLMAIAEELFGPGQEAERPTCEIPQTDPSCLTPSSAVQPAPVQSAPVRSRPARERTPERTNPTRALGLSCPWSEGTIEQRSPWDWQGML